MEYLAGKYDIEIAKREENWLSQYPNLKARIEKLEEFDGYNALDKRITKLEKKGK